MSERLIGPDGRPTEAVVIIPLATLPDCWRGPWCSDACKAQVLAALAAGQLMAPIPQGFTFPTPGRN